MSFLDFMGYIFAFCIGGLVCMVGLAISSCNHKFEVIDTLDRKNIAGARSKVYVSRCVNCGKIKRKEVK